jgi:hypothetical protein
MKAKKKLKKIKEALDRWEEQGFSGGILVIIRDILDGTHQDEEEPEPKFMPGDKVEFPDEQDLILNDFDWKIDACSPFVPDNQKRMLSGSAVATEDNIRIKVSTWVDDPAYLKKVKE